MHGAPAVLAEVNLVDVGVHDVRLLEACLENHGHHGFLGLAAQRPAAVEEVALDELLGQRAAALLDLAGAHVDERRPQDRERVHAVVSVELAVLDRLERRRQQRWHLVGCHDDPVLAVDREDAADQQRVETHDGDLATLRVLEARDDIAAKPESQRARLLLLVGEAKLAHEHADPVAAPAVRSRPVGVRDREVAEALELLRKTPDDSCWPA